MKIYAYTLLVLTALCFVLLVEKYTTSNGISIIVSQTWFVMSSFIVYIVAGFGIFTGFMLCNLRFSTGKDERELRRELSVGSKPLWGICFWPLWFVFIMLIQYDSLTDGLAVLSIAFNLMMYNSIIRKGKHEVLVEDAKRGTVG